MNFNNGKASCRPSETAQGVITKLVGREMAMAVRSLSGDPLEFPFPLDLTLHEAYGMLQPEAQAVADYSKVSASKSSSSTKRWTLCCWSRYLCRRSCEAHLNLMLCTEMGYVALDVLEKLRKPPRLNSVERSFFKWKEISSQTHCSPRTPTGEKKQVRG